MLNTGIIQDVFMHEKYMTNTGNDAGCIQGLKIHGKYRHISQGVFMTYKYMINTGIIQDVFMYEKYMTNTGNDAGCIQDQKIRGKYRHLYRVYFHTVLACIYMNLPCICRSAYTRKYRHKYNKCISIVCINGYLVVSLCIHYKYRH